MIHDPDTPPAASDGPDTLDGTQPLEVPRFVPTPDPRPDTRWAWAIPGGPAAPGSGAPAWAAPASSLSTLGAVPHPAPAGPPSRGRIGPGVGTVAVVALLSAVLASSGTVAVLDAAGSLDRHTAPHTVIPGTAGPAAGTATGTSGTVDESSAVITSSARVSPSVVKITVKDATTDPFSGTQPDGVGSGIIYDPDGWILTNHHVVTDASTLSVELKDGRTFDGRVYGVDTLTDLAIVKVDASGLPAASLGSSDELKVGQLVIAVGSPLGTYSFSVTSGIVSGKGRSIVVSDGSTISNLIQTDAAINPGNSGGPLADAEGNVVGINTAIADGSNGIGFAIPIDIAKPIMAQAVRGQQLQRPWIGVRYQAIDQKVKDAQKLSVDSGALIINGSGAGGSAVQPSSPAAGAGLRDGDIITAINGIAIDQEHPLNLLLVQFAPGDTIELTVLRDGTTMTVPLTLGVRPEDLQ